MSSRVPSARPMGDLRRDPPRPVPHDPDAPEPATNVAPPAPGTAVDVPAKAFLLGQGVEPLIESQGPDLWMLGVHSPRRRVAYVEGLGTRFGGDPASIAVFVLDRWSESPPGLRWNLDPAAPEDPGATPRAAAILSRCFARTRTGIFKLATAECGRNVEQAIAHAIHEMLDIMGLEQTLPEEVAHG